jgi:hypothetical protein
MDKLGVERRAYTAGENKDFLDPFAPENPKHKEHAQKMLGEIHEQFVKVVKTGRGARLKESPEIFSGLVWTGEKSVELGLADWAAWVRRAQVIKAERHRLRPTRLLRFPAPRFRSGDGFARAAGLRDPRDVLGAEDRPPAIGLPRSASAAARDRLRARARTFDHPAWGWSSIRWTAFVCSPAVPSAADRLPARARGLSFRAVTHPTRDLERDGALVRLRAHDEPATVEKRFIRPDRGGWHLTLRSADGRRFIVSAFVD